MFTEITPENLCTLAKITRCRFGRCSTLNCLRLKVDYIPDEELYMSEMGRIGICMAPGRTKKKKYHDWARDLGADLDRIHNVYECDVFVTLVRHLELVDIAIPNLFEEVEFLQSSHHFSGRKAWNGIYSLSN